MITRWLGILLVFAVVSTGISRASDVWTVRYDGVGPVKIGMSLSQLNSVLHEYFLMPDDDEERGCFFVSPTNHKQILFMIENGHLIRIDVDAHGITTAENLQVGDSERRALQVYGPKMKVEPHAYTGPEGHYLTVRSKSGRYGIRFETEQGKIRRFYAGRFEAIQYIEGCQ